MLQNKYTVMHTQLRQPSHLPTDHVWVPALLTRVVEHEPIVPQNILLTHIKAMQHYQHDLQPLLAHRVFCVGNHTAQQLRSMGFQDVTEYASANLVTMVQDQITPCVWLRGDKSHRDFSVHEGVHSVQTYRSYLNESAIAQIFLQDPSEMYVYSNTVLTALQKRSWPNTHLRHTAHCVPNRTLWQIVSEFDPNVEEA